MVVSHTQYIQIPTRTPARHYESVHRRTLTCLHVRFITQFILIKSVQKLSGTTNR
jgi:hypothetical protein